MTTRAGIEVMCDSHPGEPRAVARLTDFRHEPWPASSPNHAILCAQLLPGRAVTSPPEPVYGIAVTYLTHLRNGRGEWRQTATGGHVETSPDGRRRYTFRCTHERCRRSPVVVNEWRLGALIDTGAPQVFLTRLRGGPLAA